MADPHGTDPSERSARRVPSIQRGVKEAEPRVSQAVDDAARQLRTDEPAIRGAIRRPEDVTEPPVVFQQTLSCPILDVVIATPCQLTNCRYHADYKWAGNCLLIYTQQQGVDKLTVEEISYLYRMPVAEVKRLLDDGLVRLRGTALDRAANDQESLRRRFHHFITTRLCCVCESELDDEPTRGLRVDSIGAVYCSKDCRDTKPPRIIELEVDKGLPIERILEWTFRRYRTLSLAEQALRLPRWLVYEASKRFLGRPLDHYFPALRQPPRQPELIRRTWHEPSWVDALLLGRRFISAEVRARYGPATVSTAQMRQRVADVIGPF